MRRLGFYVLAAVILGALLGPSGALASPAGWSIQTPAALANTGTLQSVSCSSPGACTAVGEQEVLSMEPETQPLAERWDGSSWTLQSIPGADLPGYPGLRSVSCPTADYCLAVSSVGSYVWNGASWSFEGVPAPAGASNPALLSVSCVSALDCTGVGLDDDASSSFGLLAEHWNGSQWTIENAVTPAGFNPNSLSVSCVPGWCMTAGNGSTPFSETWNGSTWSLQSSPDATSSAYLEGLSCTSQSACTAAGQLAGSTYGSAFAVRWNGSTWTLQSTPPPAGTGNSAFGDVSCASAESCVAVGSTPDNAVLAEHWDGSAWTIDPTPVTGSPTSVLFADSCSSPTSCLGVGYTESQQQVLAPLIESYSGSSQSPPVVTTGAASDVTRTSAVLKGTVNPGGTATSCVFQWGASDGVYTHSVPVACGSGSASIAVSAKLENLVAGTSYDFRLRASSAAGTVTGAEQRFATPSSGGTSTLGNPSRGDESSTFQSGLERVNPYELYWPAVARSLSIYLQPTGTAGSQSLQLMIYADSNGVPGKLLARTAPFKFRSSDAAGWHRERLTHGVSLPDGQYWVGVLTGGKTGVAGWRYDDTGTRDTRYTPFSGGPTDPFGATDQDSAVMSLFATLTPKTGQSAAMARRARVARLDGHARMRVRRLGCRRPCRSARKPR